MSEVELQERKIDIVEDQEIALYKWCGWRYEYFSEDRKNYVCYEYKWADLIIEDLNDFKLTLVEEQDCPNEKLYKISNGYILGVTGSVVCHFANEDLEHGYYEIEENDPSLYPDEIYDMVMAESDYGKDQEVGEFAQEHDFWIRLDKDHQAMIDAFSPYIVKSEEPIHTCYEIARDEDGAMDYCLQDNFFDQNDPDPDSKYRFVVTKEKEITDEDDEKLGLRDWLWRIEVYEREVTDE